MRKIIIAHGSDNKRTDELVALIQTLFPECEIQVGSQQCTEEGSFRLQPGSVTGSRQRPPLT